MKLLLRWAILALAIWIATATLPGIDVVGGFWAYLWVALLFSLINTFIGSLLKILTFPALILTLGLFSIVINAAMLMLTARWSSHLNIDSFWHAILGAFFITLISSPLNAISKNRGLL
jgi:putative membrane protein